MYKRLLGTWEGSEIGSIYFLKLIDDFFLITNWKSFFSPSHPNTLLNKQLVPSATL